MGMPKQMRQASAATPAEYQGVPRGLGWTIAELVAAVVVTVSVEVCAVAPLMVREVGENAQVAGSLAAAGAMTQVNATAPVNPPEGVAVIVAVLPVVAPGSTVMLPLLVSVKVGATYAFTVTPTMVVIEIAPDVPVTVTA
jgi:hypothetical protein